MSVPASLSGPYSRAMYAGFFDELRKEGTSLGTATDSAGKQVLKATGNFTRANAGNIASAAGGVGAALLGQRLYQDWKSGRELRKAQAQAQKMRY